MIRTYLFCGLFIPGISMAVESFVGYVTSYSGECVVAKENGIDRRRECVGMEYVFSIKGRAGFIFAFVHQEKPQIISFGGKDDEQPDNSTYRLKIDSLDVFPKKLTAEGECVMYGDPNSEVTVECEAISTDATQPRTIQISFSSKGKPEMTSHTGK